jgi:hypothetical protein
MEFLNTQRISEAKALGKLYRFFGSSFLSSSGIVYFLRVVGLPAFRVAVVGMGHPAGVCEELPGSRNHLPQE